MATCRYCGKWAGFFSEYHEACLHASFNESEKNRKIAAKPILPQPVNRGVEPIAPNPTAVGSIGFERIIGQKTVIAQLRRVSELCRSRSEVADHILLVGPDGIGKRTVALAFAEEIATTVRSLDATTVKKVGDVTVAEQYQLC